MQNFITSLSRKLLEQAFEDWAMMVGLTIRFRGQYGFWIENSEGLRPVLDEPSLIMETRVEGESEGPLYWVFPQAFIVRVSGPMVMLSDDIMAQKEVEGLDELDLEAFQEMANLMCGAANRVFQGLGKTLRVSQDVDHLKVTYNKAGTADDCIPAFPEGPLAFVKMIVDVDGRPFRLLQALPMSLATEITEVFVPQES